MNQPTHNQEEKIQIVDAETGEPTGQCLPRSEVIKQRLWCRSTNIFILDSHGQILCNQRSLTKERFPGAWSTHFGGHVAEGESFKINALKELEEEIGLAVNHFQVIPWRTSRKNISRLWKRDFLTVFDGPLDGLKLQTEEIEQVRWFTPEQIISELEIEGKDEMSPPWLAGTHDFTTDYQCMRAVLTAVLDAKIFNSSYHPLHKWQPPNTFEEDTSENT
jgi:isopentenyldiphosphate isomerase